MNKNKYLNWALIAPALLFLLAFLVIPVIVLLVISFQGQGVAGATEGFTLERYAQILTNKTYLFDIVATLGVALLTTAIVELLAYPAANLLVKAKNKTVKSILYVMLVSPLLTSVVVRTFAWIVLLAQNGIINQVLQATGVTSEPITFLWNMGAVILAYVQVLLPLAVMPLVASLSEVKPSLRQAAMSLGAGRVRSFFQVIFPLTIPGMINGAVIVFSLAAGSYITAILVGGGMQPLLPLVIYQQALQISDLPMAAAMSIILLILVAIVILPVEFLLKRWEVKVYG